MMKKLSVIWWAAVFLIFTACRPTALSGEETGGDTGLAVGPALAQVTAVPETAGDAAAAKPAANQEAAAESAETEKLLSLSQAAGLADGAVIVFERSGGLKGIGPAETEWRFYADGRIQASDGRSWQKSPAEIQRLLSDLEANGFFDLAQKYMPADSCCDRTTYVITAGNGRQVQRVVTMDGADMPDDLARILQLFDELLAGLAEEN
jgi:hypothetical protein